MSTGHYARSFRRKAAVTVIFIFMLPLFGLIFPDKASAEATRPIQSTAEGSFQVALFEDRVTDPGTESDQQGRQPNGTQRDNAPENTPGNAPRNGEISTAESLFGGSVLGALLFGFPYVSPGAPDLLILILIFLVGRKLVMNKKQADRGKDLFNLPGRSPWPGQDNEDQDRSEPTGNNPNGGRDGRPDNGSDNNRERKNNGGLPPNWQGRGGGQKRDDSGNGPWRTSAEDRDNGELPNMKSRARATWDALRSAPPQGGKARQAPPADQGGQPSRNSGGRSASGFDENEFLAGARALYVRLQTSWGARDVNDLEPFMTPSMMKVLREQADLNPTPVQVQVLMVTAVLADVTTIAQTGETRASVTFDAVIHEGPQDQGEPLNVHELWHFVRGPESGGSWRLDNIDQE